MLVVLKHGKFKIVKLTYVKVICVNEKLSLQTAPNTRFINDYFRA